MLGTITNMEPWNLLITVFVSVVIYSRFITATLLGQREHKTPQAAEKANDLSCYVCDTMDVGISCANLVNNSLYIQKCYDDRRTCMVKNFSYHTSSENTTKPLKHLWSLQRNCTNKCEPGCIVIGERTKLYACTACCEKSLCNVGDSSTKLEIHPTLIAVLNLVVLVTFASWPNLFRCKYQPQQVVELNSHLIENSISLVHKSDGNI